MKRRVPTETQECRAFVEWTKLVTYAGEPLFARLAKIANERGKAGPMTAIMTAIGMRKGFPDYIVLIPTRKFAGLFIEAKRIGGTADREQLEWRDRLIGYGYYAEICAGAAQMIDATRAYLTIYADPLLWTDRTRAIA